MVELFCKLEKDEKTHRYLQTYLDFISQNRDTQTDHSILGLDNIIQKDELITHLSVCHIDPYKESEERMREAIEWINKNGKAFRQYLSSIKLLACLAYSKGYRVGNDITTDVFHNICEEINELKGVLIDYIF